MNYRRSIIAPDFEIKKNMKSSCGELSIHLEQCEKSVWEGVFVLISPDPKLTFARRKLGGGVKEGKHQINNRSPTQHVV